jgi:hypothetical protein
MKLSAKPVERSPENMWMKLTNSRKSPPAAENGPILHRFYGPRLTGSNDEDCYTLEHFASDPDVIHNTCYCYY